MKSRITSMLTMCKQICKNFTSGGYLKSKKNKLFLLFIILLVIVGIFSITNVTKKSYALNNVLYEQVKTDATTNGYGGTYTGEHGDKPDGTSGEKDIYYYTQTGHNYVKLGEHCWTVLRTTDTGGVRLHYEGPYSSSYKCDTHTSSSSYYTTNSTSEKVTVNATDIHYSGTSCSGSGASFNCSGGTSGNALEYSSGYSVGSGTVSSYTVYSNCNQWNTKPVCDRQNRLCEVGMEECCEPTSCTATTYTRSLTSSSTTYNSRNPISTSSSKYNDSTNSPMYVGYKYSNSSPYNGNSTNSTIKNTIETWYNNNLNSLDDLIEDTPYCNDRGTDDNGTACTSSSSCTYRNNSTVTDLSCKNSKDRFSLDSSDAKLSYPIGLPTAPEINLVGTNTSKRAYSYWTMSPITYESSTAKMRTVTSSGSLTSTNTNSNNYIYPVVSLAPNIEYTSGSGTKTSPYILNESSGNRRILYLPGKGTLTGKRSESVTYQGNPTGSSVTPPSNKTFEGWTIDRNVTLSNGNTVNTGTVLSNEQVKQIVVKNNLKLTAKYDGSGDSLYEQVKNDVNNGKGSKYNGSATDKYDDPLPAGYRKLEYNEYVSVTNDTTYPYSWSTSDKTWTSTNHTDSKSGTIEFKINKAGNYKLVYTVSSESNYDKAYFYKNDTAIGDSSSGISGSVSNEISLSDLKTTDTIKVTYTKDSSRSSGSDDVVFYLMYYESPTYDREVKDVYYYTTNTNNNVKLGNICFEILRTTNTGGVKLIYNGLYSDSTGCNNTGTSQQLSTISKFDNTYNDAKYAGYNTSAESLIGKEQSVYNITANNSSYPFTWAESDKTWTSTNHSSSSSSEISFSVTTAGDYKLYYKVSSESNYDKAYFYKNDTAIGNSSSGISGEATSTIDLTGLTTSDVIKVKYTKDGSQDKGSDNVVFKIGTETGTVWTGSTIKEVVDDWYSENMTDYTRLLENAVFCNERSGSTSSSSAATGTTWNGSGTSTFYYRNYSSTFKDLSCISEKDRFSKDNNNAKLEYPVGLITAPEVRLIGTTLAKTGQNYYTMSPNYFAGYAYMNYVNTSGSIASGYNTSYGVRPVLSLKEGALYTDGEGTVADPYEIKTSITAKFYFQSNTTNGQTKVSSKEVSCTPGSNGTCSVTIPQEVKTSVGTYNNSYAGLSKSTDNMNAEVSSSSNTATISEDTIFYSVYSTPVTNYYYSN